MHELSICRAIAATATEHAGGRPVERIRLRIGHFRQVVPDTLTYCWELHTRDTDLAGCGLDVDYVPAIGRCPSCGADTELAQPILICGSCDTPGLELIQGEEFLIESIDVAQEAH